MSERASAASEKVRVRAHSRSGPGGLIDVARHERWPPSGGGPSATDRAYLGPANVAKVQRQMEDYLTFFRQNAERDRSRGADKGWDLAVRHLEHFLDGTGTPVVLTSEQVARMPALVRAEEGGRLQFERTFPANTDTPQLNARVRSLADGGSIEIEDSWDMQARSIDNRVGDYAAIGRSSIHSEGRFRTSRKSDVITFEGYVTHRLGARDIGGREPYYRDRYDFEAGQPGSFPAITLEHAGKARSFDMLSEPRRQRVTAKVRIRPDGGLVLDSPPVWGPIR